MQPLCRSFDPAAVVHAVLQSRECVTADESDSVRDADFDVCVFLPVWEVRPEVIDRPNLDLPVLLEFLTSVWDKQLYNTLDTQQLQCWHRREVQ